MPPQDLNVSSPIVPNIDSVRILCMIRVAMLVRDTCSADVCGCIWPLLSSIGFLQAAVHDANTEAEPHVTMAGCPELYVSTAPGGLPLLCLTSDCMTSAS